MKGGLALAAAAAALAVTYGTLGRAEELAAADAHEVRFVDAIPRGPSVATRLTEIRRRIQAAVVYPPLARRQQFEGVTLVRFEIEPDGTPQGVVVHRSSGRPSLDRAATGAVERAAPLPWVYGRLEVPVRFALETRR
jgi:TonB family protein